MDQIQQLGFPELVVFCTVAILLFWGEKIPEVARKLNEGLNNFRGGPGSPSHPLPADDSKHLNRRIRRSHFVSARFPSRSQSLVNENLPRPFNVKPMLDTFQSALANVIEDAKNRFRQLLHR